MNEVFPIVGGLLLGALLVRIPAGRRLWVGLAGAVVIGFLATVISGEYRLGWEFLLIDIPGTALAAACSFAVLRRLRSAQAVRAKADD
jgi:hypothetical protein